MQDPSQSFSELEALAAKHGLGVEAARHMLRALDVGGGTMAQFDHPEFGGMGQWFAGGMVMVGRMNDHALKARVSALCEDLAVALSSRDRASASASSRSHATSCSISHGASTCFQAASGDWWPDGLGRPASVGAQNATRYAYFPESRRLAIHAGGEVALYDTGDRVITGAAQQQGGVASFVFTGPDGTVALDSLKRVESGGEGSRPGRGAASVDAPSPTASDSAAPAPAHPPAASRPAAQGGDPLAILERLAALHRNGILTDEEFANKKAELLARL